MKSVIVVGAGFAGLSAALALARTGMRVTVLERHAGAGGRARRISQNGFTFDAGPTLLVMVDALRETLGAAAFDALQLARLEPGYRVFWPSGEPFEMSSNLAVFLESIARLEGFDRRSPALEYLAEVHEQYVQARARILEVDHTLASFARTLLTPGKFAPWSLGRLPRFARRYFKNERTVQAMTFQPLYLGTSPLRAPAIYAMLAVEEIVGGVWYAPGGTGAIVERLVRECEARGVEFRFETPVRRVVHGEGRAFGVDCERERFEADGVVVTADREPAMHALFGVAPARERTVRYGHSAMVWYLGVRGEVALPHHSVMLPENPWSAYAALDRARLPADPLVYVCNAAATDPNVAPAGCSALMVLAPVPNAGALERFDEGEFRSRVLERLERHTGPLRDRIVVERSQSPRGFASQLGLANGAAFGPDHTLDQMGPFRPSIRHPHLGNVVFAGSGTQPGSGVPMVLISGRLAAERLAAAIA